MTQTRFRMRRLALAVALSACCPALFAATEFPQPGKPIRLVVGFPAGGGLDVLARTISKRLGEELGASVIVENKAGAGGQIGLEQVARSTPDGHTLHIASGGPYTINPVLRPGADDPSKAMRGVSLLARMPLLLVTAPNSGIHSVGELLAKGKATSLSYGSGGTGTLSHMAGEYFKLASGLRVTHVPYKGTAPAAIDIASGLVPYALLDPSVAPLIAANKLKVLGVTTQSSLFPGVKTLAQSGVADYELVNWYGLAAPSGVPTDVVDKLQRALTVIMREPAIVQTLAANGMEAVSSTPAQFDTLVTTERVKWARVAHQAHVTVD